DVRRLQIAMYDEVAVRVRDRGEHVDEQPHASFDIETMLIRMTIDALAVDVFEHEVRLTARRDPGVDQLRDVRMLQLREHRSFAHEPLLGRPTEQRRVQQLDRRPGFVTAVAAVREPDLAHATLADALLERVRADAGAGPRSILDGSAGLRSQEKPSRVERGNLGEESAHLAGD